MVASVLLRIEDVTAAVHKAQDAAKTNFERQDLTQRTIAQLVKDAQSLADKISSLEVTVERTVGSEDKLFGSVTGRDIADALDDAGADDARAEVVHDRDLAGRGLKAVHDRRVGR